jgi:hypothetical protein
VGPKETVFGDRGVYEELAGFTWNITYSNCNTKLTKGKIGAPYREGWHVYYGG